MAATPHVRREGREGLGGRGTTVRSPDLERHGPTKKIVAVGEERGWATRRHSLRYPDSARFLKVADGRRGRREGLGDGPSSGRPLGEAPAVRSPLIDHGRPAP